jgi:hypothetical protein
MRFRTRREEFIESDLSRLLFLDMSFDMLPSCSQPAWSSDSFEERSMLCSFSGTVMLTGH